MRRYWATRGRVSSLIYLCTDLYGLLLLFPPTDKLQSLKDLWQTWAIWKWATAQLLLTVGSRALPVQPESPHVTPAGALAHTGQPSWSGSKRSWCLLCLTRSGAPKVLWCAQRRGSGETCPPWPCSSCLMSQDDTAHVKLSIFLSPVAQLRHWVWLCHSCGQSTAWHEELSRELSVGAQVQILKPQNLNS